MERTRAFYILLFIGLSLATVGTGVAFVLLGESWFQLIVAGVLGILLTQFAFITHEASHRQVLESGPANDRIGRFLATAVVGMSYSWWMNKHNRHHGNPNKVGKDPDIEVDTISFIAEDAAKSRGFVRLITRHQGYLFFPLLTLEGLNLHRHSLVYLFGKGPIAGRAYELTAIAIHFALYLTAIFWFLPLGMGFAFLGVQMAVFGVYMGISFAPNHKGMPLIGPDEKLDFFSKQVRTSRNISGGIWASSFMGGLNYQIEHHLFPSMPRPHLARARTIVRQYCIDNNVAYAETTVLRSYGIVVRYLNRVGLSARDPFDCPAAGAHRRR